MTKTANLPGSRTSNQGSGGLAATEPDGFFAPRLILVPLDLRCDALHTVRCAAALADTCGARLSLLHVLDPIAWPADAGCCPTIAAEDASSVAAKLRAHAVGLARSAGRASVETHVGSGSAAFEICEAARLTGAGLIVLSTRLHPELQHKLFGGTTKAVVRHAPCPVLLLPEETSHLANEQTAAGIPWRSLLVPTDLSVTSEKAIRYAAGVAKLSRGTVSLVHVVDSGDLDDLMALSGGDVNQISSDLRARLAALLERSVPEALRGDIYVRRGVPFAHIIAIAATAAADLVVLTTYGRTDPAHRRMGGTAERLMHHLHTPLLILGRG